MVMDVNADNFMKETFESDKPVLIDVWAEWCGPCRVLGPIIEQLATEMTNVKFVKLNAEENESVVASLNVSAFPTMLIIQDGEIKDMRAGLMQKPQLIQWINSTIS